MGTAPRNSPPEGWAPSAAMSRWLATQPSVDDGLPPLFPEDVSAVTRLAGKPLSVLSVHRANYNGKLHRRTRRPALPSDLPPPAGHRSRSKPWPQRSGPPSPYWWPWAIDTWLAGRRGPGKPPSATTRTSRVTLTEGEPIDHPRQAAG